MSSTNDWTQIPQRKRAETNLDETKSQPLYENMRQAIQPWRDELLSSPEWEYSLSVGGCTAIHRAYLRYVCHLAWCDIEQFLR